MTAENKLKSTKEKKRRPAPPEEFVEYVIEITEWFWEYAFLTTEPNAEVGAIHPKAMPVILTTPDEVEAWLTASPDDALKLQRPLPDGALRIVARGVKEDPAVTAV
jgi:putative SOS response-associated peptidase YedK